MFGDSVNLRRSMARVLSMPFDTQSVTGPDTQKRALVFAINNSAVIVPYVTDVETKILKTACPSRCATKLYLSL